MLFAYCNDAGETTIAENLNKSFPTQFASALRWHRETLDKIYGLGSIYGAASGPENYFSGESQFARDLPVRFMAKLRGL